MATITDFVDGTIQKSVASQHVNSYPVKNEVTIDFSEKTAPASDTVQAMVIPKGADVSRVIVNVVTAEGSAGNIDVGDSDPDGWQVDTDINATGRTVDVDAAYPAVGGKLYTAEDTIDITPSIELDTAVVTIVAEYSINQKIANS